MQNGHCRRPGALPNQASPAFSLAHPADGLFSPRRRQRAGTAEKQVPHARRRQKYPKDGPEATQVKAPRQRAVKRKKLQTEICSSFISDWCPGGDSNSHAIRRYHLKIVCLPIPPPGHEVQLIENRPCWQAFFHSVPGKYHRRSSEARRGRPCLPFTRASKGLSGPTVLAVFFPDSPESLPGQISSPPFPGRFVWTNIPPPLTLMINAPDTSGPLA